MKGSAELFRVTVVALGALALSACASVVPPAGLTVDSVEFDASTSEVEFVGPVESIASESWTIGGVPVAISTETEIDSGLAVGDLAKVHALVGPDASLAAREIQGVDAPSIGGADESALAEVEFIDSVVSIAPESWMVGSQTLAVVPETEIKDAIVVGDTVKVHAISQADGSLTAREIELASVEAGATSSTSEDLHFTGWVETIGPDLWVVGGTTFLLGPDTEIEGGIVVGDFVKVEAALQSDGSYLAREIKLADEGDLPGEKTEFFGQVTAMEPGTWIVGGLTFVVTPDTEIKDVIVVGDFVKVEAFVGADGSLTAHEIELDDDAIQSDDDGDDDDIEDEHDQDEDEDEDDHSDSGGSGGSDD
jgi:hypothetical protein